MTEKFIIVREAEVTTRTYLLLNRDLGDEKDPDDAVDITGYAFLLRVRRTYIDVNEDLRELEIFTLAGAIVTAVDGEFKFDLTSEHTALVPATYDAEILFWSSGTVTDEPTGHFNVTYTVEERLGSP